LWPWTGGIGGETGVSLLAGVFFFVEGVNTRADFPLSLDSEPFGTVNTPIQRLLRIQNNDVLWTKRGVGTLIPQCGSQPIKRKVQTSLCKQRSWQNSANRPTNDKRSPTAAAGKKRLPAS